MTPLFTISFTLPRRAVAGVDAGPLCPSDVPLCCCRCGWRRASSRSPDGAASCASASTRTRSTSTRTSPSSRADERAGAQRYWEQDWRAGNDAARAARWRQLADRFGAARAAWIAARAAADQPGAAADIAAAGGPAATARAGVPARRGRDRRRADAWRHAPQARLLPDRWIASCTRAASRARRPRPRHPTPARRRPRSAGAAARSGDRAASDRRSTRHEMDGRLRRSRSGGHGAAHHDPAATLAAGLDSLVVFGVAASLDARRTPRCSSPTCSTRTTTPTASSSCATARRPTTPTTGAPAKPEDPGHARSFATRSRPIRRRSTHSNALQRRRRAGSCRARSIAPTLGHLGRAARQHDADQRSMNTALWQVGWGYFLSNMIGFDDGPHARRGSSGRATISSPTCARRAAPALRCGRQPYGVLPVTSLDSVGAGRGRRPRSRATPGCKACSSICATTFWRPALDRSPRRQRQIPPDPDADLADVMRTDGVLGGYRVRSRLRPPLPRSTCACSSARIFRRGFIAAQDASPAACCSASASRWRPRTGARPSRESNFALTAPLVQTRRSLAVDSARAELHRGAAREPKHRRPDRRAPAADATRRRTSLLQTLLRHALLREIADAAARIAAHAPGDLAALLRDAELDRPGHRQQRFRATCGSASSTRRSPAVTGDSTIRDFIEDALRGFDRRRGRSPRSASFAPAWRACRRSTAKRCSC